MLLSIPFYLITSITWKFDKVSSDNIILDVDTLLKNNKKKYIYFIIDIHTALAAVYI
jgi:hypothetical protein